MNQEIKIDYDDSLIIDKETILERKRNDAVTFDIPQLTIWYLMDAYNLTEEEATRIYREKIHRKMKQMKMNNCTGATGGMTKAK